VTLPEGYRTRPASQGDIRAMADVANAYDLADVGHADTEVEHLGDAWRVPGFEAERDTWLVHGSDGTLAAFGLVEPTPGEVLGSFGRVRPEHRGRGLGTFLVASMEARAMERGGSVRLLNDVTVTDVAARTLLEGRGYAPVRFFWHMERDLDDAEVGSIGVPAGLVVRAAREQDERPAWAAIEEAFVDHWSWESEPFEDWVAFLRSSDGRILVAAEGPEVAGAVTLRVMRGSGWIGELGVRRPWRGRGVGEALLRHAFAALARLGARTARLNVDADNRTGATRLYERVGMHVRREWIVYEKRLGEDVGTTRPAG
jgi:mycothiol synthase